MPTVTKDFAKVQLTSKKSGTDWTLVMKVWNRSCDHSDAVRRQSLITKVELLNLPSTQHQLTLERIVDAHGQDIHTLWPHGNVTMDSVGFVGYSERSEPPGTIWALYAGIYDGRCLSKAAVDAQRLRTHKNVTPPSLTVYEYIVGPVTFSFRLNQFTRPGTARITFGFIGGRAGSKNPFEEQVVIPF